MATKATVGAKPRKKPKTKYQILVSTKKAACKGKKTAADVTAAKNKYIEDAVKKGKDKKDATAIANKVTNAGCSTIAGAKKKVR